MVEQLSFGILAGTAGKEEGLDRVESNNSLWVSRMRSVAREMARNRGTVSSDDLRSYADANNFHPRHKNAWGAIFRGKEWETVGFASSRYVSNHARRVFVWRIRSSASL